MYQRNYKIEAHTFQSIVSRVSDGEIQLCNFQRKWVWDDDKIKGLLTSIIKGYPIGILIFLKGATLLAYRPISSVKLSTEKYPEYLILDGQQRLTSFYQVCSYGLPVTIMGKRRRTPECRKYYLRLKNLQTNLDEAVVSLQSDATGTLFSKIPKGLEWSPTDEDSLVSQLIFPLDRIFHFQTRERWINRAMTMHGEHNRDLKVFIETVLPAFTQGSIPTFELDGRQELSTIAEIYQVLNKSGVQLKTFDLLISMHATEKYNLYKAWFGSDESEKSVDGIRNEIHLHSGKFEYDVDPKYFMMGIQKISSFLGGKPFTKFKELKTAASDVMQYADSLVGGFQKAFEFLRNEGIRNKSCLPQSVIVLELAVFFAVAKTKLKSVEDHLLKEKLSLWLWRMFIGDPYDAHVEERVGNDIEQMLAHLFVNDAVEPVAMTRMIITTRDIIEATSLDSSLARALVALMTRADALDFIANKNLKDADAVDIHHIFPKAWCVRKGIDLERYDSVVNKTPLRSGSNRAIGGSAPSAYTGKILEDVQYPDGKFADILESHGIRLEDLQTDNFNSHFDSRLERLRSLISRVTRLPVIDAYEGNKGTH